jgi:acetylornithine deacetylase/succinyl-diaminopimelate desuccinylase-like protein
MPLDLLAISRSLIATDSRSSVSSRPVVDLLLPLCDAAGLQTTLFEESRDGVSQYDLVAVRPGASDLPPLLLNTHLDTVPPGDPELWTECGGSPLRLTQRDGMLYGLGTADVKLDFACKLLALERLRDEPLHRTVVLAGTYGEETGRWGAQLLARTLRPLPAMALVGEPTSRRPCSSHKGYLEIHVSATEAARPPGADVFWRLEFGGVAAHSSQPHKGLSANDVCLDALAQLDRSGTQMLALDGGDLVNRVSTQASMVVGSDKRPAVAGARIEQVERPSAAMWAPGLSELLLAVHQSTIRLREDLQSYVMDGFDPPWSTVNNGLVEIGGGFLRHVVDVRRLFGEQPESAIAAHLERLRAAVRSSTCEAEVTQWLDSPPFQGDDASRVAVTLRRILRARGMPVEPERKSGTTEASVYATLGIDTLVFGPGAAGGNIHRPNEHVPLEDLHAAIDVYTDVVKELASA